MVEVGTKIFTEKYNGDLRDMRTGFTWPPFNTVII
jgi:hypothetical protein